MFIDFANLALEMSRKRLTLQEVKEEQLELCKQLLADDVDPGLVSTVMYLIDDALETGYDGGYSDAHWYAKGIGDGA